MCMSDVYINDQRDRLIGRMPEIVTGYKVVKHWATAVGMRCFQSIYQVHRWRAGVNVEYRDSLISNGQQGFHVWLHQRSAEQYLRWYTDFRTNNTPREALRVIKVLMLRSQIRSVGRDFTHYVNGVDQRGDYQYEVEHRRDGLSVTAPVVIFDPTQEYSFVRINKWVMEAHKEERVSLSIAANWQTAALFKVQAGIFYG